MKRLKTAFGLFLGVMTIILILAGCNNNISKDYIIDKDGGYIVYTADGLLTWAERVKSDQRINCTLAEDIDLPGKNWVPLCNDSKGYTGVFNGAGHTISGITIRQPVGRYVGFFSLIETNGRVEELTLENVVVDLTTVGGDRVIGGIAGLNNFGKILNCNVSGSFTVMGSSLYTGGVAGANSGLIQKCKFEGDINTTDKGSSYTGGMAGSNEFGTIIECYISADINSTGTNKICVGGVAGQNYMGRIENCTILGTVTGSGPYIKAGEVVGKNDGGIEENNNISDCIVKNF